MYNGQAVSIGKEDKMLETGKVAAQGSVQNEKEGKAKKLLDEILKQLKELVSSSTSVSEVRSKIDMLRELDPVLAEKLDKLLDELEKRISNHSLNEGERLKLLMESIGNMQKGNLEIFNPINPVDSLKEDKPYRPDRIDGQISVSI